MSDETKALVKIKDDGKANAVAVAIMSYGEKKDLAKTIALAKICEWTEAQVFVMGLKAEAEGLPFIQALDHFDIIMGKPARKAISMEAKYRAAGGRIKYLRRDEKVCIAEFTNPGDAEPTPFSWTKEDADTYMVYEKGSMIPISKKSNWQGRKKMMTMLCWRTISEGCKAMMPESFLGFKIEDEVEEEVEERIASVTVNVSNEPGGDKSETFGAAPVETVSGEVMWTREQKEELLRLVGKGKVMKTIRERFGLDKQVSEFTFEQAMTVIEEATTPVPAPETPPERKPEAPQGKVERPEDIDLDDDPFTNGEIGK